jgi:hypothetical protein
MGLDSPPIEGVDGRSVQLKAIWPAAGSADTELSIMMEPEVVMERRKFTREFKLGDQRAGRLVCPGFPDLSRVTSRGPSHNSTSRPFTH